MTGLPAIEALFIDSSTGPTHSSKQTKPHNEQRDSAFIAATI